MDPTKLPKAAPAEIKKAHDLLSSHGWQYERQTGPHLIYRHPERPTGHITVTEALNPEPGRTVMVSHKTGRRRQDTSLAGAYNTKSMLDTFDKRLKSHPPRKDSFAFKIGMK